MTSVNKISLFFGALCLTAIFTFFNSTRMEALGLFPIALLFIYMAIFESEKFFLSIAFLTPLSVNIEEYTDSLGLFLPTEPLLFGLMILFSCFRKKCVPNISKGIINQSLAKTDLKEIKGSVLVIEVKMSQIIYDRTQIMIGFRQILTSKKGDFI